MWWIRVQICFPLTGPLWWKLAVMYTVDVFFLVGLNKLVNKQPIHCWIEMPWRLRSANVMNMQIVLALLCLLYSYIQQWCILDWPNWQLWLPLMTFVPLNCVAGLRNQRCSKCNNSSRPWPPFRGQYFKWIFMNEFFLFWFEFHSSLFPGVHLITSPHCFPKMSVQKHIWQVIEGIWLINIAVNSAVKIRNICRGCIK